MVVIITSTGGVSKRLFTYDRPVDAGPRRLGRVLPERGAGRPRRRRPHAALAAHRPDAAADRARVPRGPRARVHRARRDRRGLALRRGHRPAAGRAPLPGRLPAQRAARHARAPRVAARRALRGARPARPLRADRRRERRARAAGPVARRRELRAAAAQPRHGLGDRAHADGLRGARSAPSAPPRCSSPASSKTSTTPARPDMPRDPYEVLGVGRSADETEIKKAFRRLARELHPDTNSTTRRPRTKFKEAAEAYEVLSDADRRRQYDAYGHDGLRSGGYAPNFEGFGSVSDLFSAFFGSGGFDSAFGSGRGRPRRRGCRAATSSSRSPSTSRRPRAASGSRSPTTPTSAASTATATAPSRARRSSPARAARAPASCSPWRARASARWSAPRCATVCGGDGRVPEQPCGVCGGDGMVREERTLAVDVPAGIADGQRIRLSGRGHAGERGGPERRPLRPRPRDARTSASCATRRTCTR